MDSSLIVYTKGNLSYIPVAPNTTLENALIAINTAFNNVSGAPNYSGYNLYCVKETDGTTHPTNTQNFAEGISKMLCDFKTAYTTFTGTTYVSDQSIITTAITGLQVPAVTYATFSITNTDTTTQVWNKSFTGFTNIINSIKPDSANWSSIGASTATSTVAAFNTLIAYELTQDGLITGKQASLGTFNTTSIGGGTGTAPATAITQLITAVAAVPSFTPGSITTTCVTAGGSLQAVVQNIATAVDSVSTHAFTAVSTGLIITSTSGCNGKTIGIDTTWTSLYKVGVTDTDPAPSWLAAKITSLDNSITLTVNEDTSLDLSITIPNDGKIKVNTNDPTTGYIEDKLVSTSNSIWGLGTTILPDNTNSHLQLTPAINGRQFWAALASYISSDPDAISLLASLNQQVNSIPGLAITDLVVSPNSPDFDLSWTPQTGTSQTAKWRNKGDAGWHTFAFSPTNPLSITATTTSTSGASITVNTTGQFQVDTTYATGTAYGNIYEMINYAATTLSHGVSSGVISVSQSPLILVDTIEYRLKNSVPAIIQSRSTSGASPNTAFTTVASGNYTVEWRFGTSINGGTLYSDDASQVGSWFVSGTIVVP